MGILNLTPDSFSDGGEFLDPNRAVDHAQMMIEQGAQIIDLGAESTRPGSDPVSEQDELSRILPVLEKLPKDQFLISLDTTKPSVAQAALQSGVHLINDVSGGNPELLALARRYQAGFILMHAQGKPKTMQNQPSYQNVVGEVRDFFDSKKEILAKSELPKVWMDPGIGFGKSLDHNLELMSNLKSLTDDSWGLLSALPASLGSIIFAELPIPSIAWADQSHPPCLRFDKAWKSSGPMTSVRLCKL